MKKIIKYIEETPIEELTKELKDSSIKLIDNTLSPSQLWIAIESGAYPPNSLFRDQEGNIFIFTGKSLQVHETDKEDDVYVGLCVGDKLEFIGVWGCTSDIFPIWDKLSELERECDNQIKQQKEVSLCNYSK